MSSQLFFGQFLLGMINGSFYAMLSLGIAIIFGLLRVANFAHGAQYMLGAFVALFLLNLPTIFPGLGFATISFWWALLIAPVVVGLSGVILERLLIQRIYHLDHVYGLVLTVGAALLVEGAFRNAFGSTGFPYPIPSALQGGVNLGFMFLPYYRAFVIVLAVVICFSTWFCIERTRLGMYLRAASENPTLVRAFGINVPMLLTLTYGLGVALAALAGVLAAPIYQVAPLMGSSLVIVVFAVVVIGGMGSILGSILSGFALGIIEGLTKVVYAPASSTVIFVMMGAVLLFRPQGIMGKA